MKHSFLTFVVLVTNKKGTPFRLKRLTASIEPWITLSSMCIVPLKSIKRPRGLLTRAITEKIIFDLIFYFISFNFLILVCFCLLTEKLDYFKRNLSLIRIKNLNIFSGFVHSIFSVFLEMTCFQHALGINDHPCKYICNVITSQNSFDFL